MVCWLSISISSEMASESISLSSIFSYFILLIIIAITRKYISNLYTSLREEMSEQHDFELLLNLLINLIMQDKEI